MALFQITALLILILGTAWICRIKFVEAVPVTVCMLTLLLCALSFGNALWMWDFLSVLLPASAGIYLWRAGKERRREVFSFVGRQLADAGTITALALTAAVTVCVGQKAVSWWDDYNFWAVDVKSLFYLNGFADKYANVAAEFGDYPPGTQMMKWVFLHFSPHVFREGLMFAGYYFLNVAFLFPFLKYIKKRNPVLMLLGGVLLWIFPSVAEVFWIDGCCADLTMALAYGGFLMAVTDREGHSEGFYYGRQALYLMMVVLCKNTGFIWAAFGLLFDYGYHFVMHRKDACEISVKRAHRRRLMLVTALPVITEGVWLSFCLLNRRVAKLTGTAIKMATGNMNIPEYQGEMVNAFVEAFVKWPLHRGRTPAIDLSPLALYLLILLSVFLLWRFHLLEKEYAVFMGVFLAVSGAVFYAFNLLSHLTIFAVETQYLEPFGMVSSIERYGAPFTIGGLCLIASIVLEKSNGYKGAAVCMLFILLTADYQGAYRGIWGYRESREAILAERNEIIDEAAERFLAGLGEKGQESVGRVLYLRDSSDVSWVRNTYIGFEASPVSVLHGNVNAEDFQPQDIQNAVSDAHASLLYVDELKGDGQRLFAPFLDGEDMEYGCLYRLNVTAEGMEMRKYEED
ncbi:MAG: hypothetical protein NC429_05830 [Lachnospiraceae bacterium]|nr:hypothetical protein [Lachnospiraceae bacterium]